MSVPILGLSLGYMYHPMYPSPKYEVPRGEPLPRDPTQWEPDVISLELEAGPAALKMFGSLLAMMASIKVCPVTSKFLKRMFDCFHFEFIETIYARNLSTFLADLCRFELGQLSLFA